MKKSEMRSGAKALVESLEKAGVDVLFGYPGGAVLDVFNCLTDAKFPFVLGRHEQGCIHMADGYARSTGKPGVCLVTSGPGATNTISGLATANIDGIPLILITGQVALPLIGTDAFQEADTTGITRAVCKHNFLVHSADEIPETVAQAFYIATHGKPGPVVIDIPKNCQQSLTSQQYPERVSLRAYHPESAATTTQLNKLAKMINEAKRPVIYAGGGVIASGAAKDVAILAHKAEIPVATTLMGLGAFDERDPLALRLAGMHGTPAANWAINEADLIIALGVRFSDRVTGKISKYAPKAKIVHVDCDPSSIGKNVEVDLGIVADVKDVLTTVGSRIKAAKHTEWLATIAAWQKSHPVAYKKMHEGVIMPQSVVEAIDKATDGKAVIVTDVGQNQIWSCNYHVVKNGRFMTSGGMGTMGYSIPAAMGAKVGCPNRQVVAVCGDGSFQMSMMELATMRQHGVAVKVMVIKNNVLGMVRQYQHFTYKDNYSVIDLTGSPDLEKIAQAYDMPFIRVKDMSEADAAIDQFLSTEGSVLMECLVDPMDLV